MKTRLLTALCAAFSTSALADNNYYYGMDLGTTSLSNVTVSGPNGPATFPNPGNVRFSFGGKLSDQFALEAGYTIFGDSILDFGSSGKVTFSLQSFQVAGIGMLPINDHIGAFARLGFAKNSADAKTEIPGNPTSTYSASNSGLIWGLGLQYKVNDRLSVRGEYADYGKFGSHAADPKATAFTIGLTYGF